MMHQKDFSRPESDDPEKMVFRKGIDGQKILASLP
jgi:hypothetical protein